MSPKVNPSTTRSSTALKRKPTRAGRWRWLWLLFSLSGVAVVSASAGALLAVALAGTPLMQHAAHPDESDVFNQDEPISTGLNLRLPKLTRPVNILVLGVKVLSTDVADPPDEVRGLGYHALVNSLEGLSDTMLLVRFNPDTHQVVVLSLPRDTRTWVDGAGLTKLNAANAFGGPTLAARATSELLGGVKIDRYIRINVQGVEKLVDALGGVTVFVPKDMRYQDDSQHLYINLAQGEQHLTGAQAMQFLRFRYDEYGDIGRVQRQQMLMRALVEQTLKPATLTRFPQIISVIQSNLDTNLSVEELIALVGFTAQTDRPNMQMVMLPGYFGSEAEYGASYWLPNYPALDSVVQQYFNREGVTYVSTNVASAVKIAVQDSTGDAFVVPNVINKLANVGYSNTFMDMEWDSALTTTQIIAQQGDLRSAETIRQVLGFGEVVVESTGSLDSDVTIRVGQDAFQVLQPVEAPGADNLDDPYQEPDAMSNPGMPDIQPELLPPDLETSEVSDPGVSDLEEPLPTVQLDPLQ